MKKPQPKKHFQIQRLFGLARTPADAAGIPVKEFLEEIAFSVTRKPKRLSELTFAEANDMIVRLGGTAFAKYGHSKRSENLRKQAAGIKSIETPKHLYFIDELARLRNMTPEGLERMGTRMLKHWPPRTTEDGNKIIEALKAMNKRDGITADSAPRTPHSELESRRSA